MIIRNNLIEMVFLNSVGDNGILENDRGQVVVLKLEDQRQACMIPQVGRKQIKTVIRMT